MKTYNALLILGTLLQVSVASFSQVENDKSTLKAAGKSTILVKATKVTIQVRLTSKAGMFTKAIDGLSDKTKTITSSLLKNGFNDGDFKMSSFSINENTQFKNGRYLDSGKVAKQAINLELKNDKQLISKALKTLSETGIDVSIEVSFGISDSEKKPIQDQLIKQAINDSFEKAKSIAATSGITLKKIKEIIYGQAYGNFGGMRQTTPGTPSFDRIQYMVDGLNISSDELKFEDGVTIVWEIE